MTYQHPSPDHAAAGLGPGTPQQAIHDLRQDAEVYSADGELLGRIAEIEAQNFRVAVSNGRDFWLERERVREASAVRIVVEFDSSELASHTLKRPAPGDALLSGDEQERQRTSMEDELERQRAARL